MNTAMHTLLPGTLGRFQDAFAQALLSPEAVPATQVAALTSQPAFAVYRNTVMKACIDALQANFPAVERLVGEEWFRAAAAVYVREQLPAEPTLLRYGATFANFLAHFEPAAELPYLPAVARLDYLWIEIHTASDAATLAPDAIARLAPDALASAVLQPHPAARWAWFSDAPIYSIWSGNRSAGTPDGDIEWRPEGALLTRVRDAVEWIVLDAAGCAFLDACAAGETLATATKSALTAQHDADLTQLMSSLLQAGAFSYISLDNEK
jgi:hypothetical protein